MRKILILTLGMAVLALPTFATTKTVGKSGADYTSIQAAIDSFTDAELKDGTPDVVEIIDGESYDEQVVVGRLIANPDGLAPGYLDEVIAFVKDQDPFTLRGADPNNRPKINPVTGGDSYGVFTNDPGDNFVASFSYLGKNISVENVEILQSSIISDDQYGMNGQAGNMTFKNVLFAHDGDREAGEAIINFNNAADIAGADIGIDNSYTFIDCTFDATFNGGRNPGIDTIYFHGMSQGDADDAGVNIADIGAKVLFDGCSFINGDTATIIRGRDQANDVTFKNCFVMGNNHGLRGSGQGTFTIENSIFYENMQNGGDADNDVGAVETIERNGYTPQLTIKNSLFVKNLSADFDSLAGIPGFDFRAGAILLKAAGTDPDITIENCTFVDNPVAIRFEDRGSQSLPRNAVVNNNIFQNQNSSVLTADNSSADSYFNSVADDEPVVSLVVNGTNNVFDGNNMIVELAERLPNVKLEGTEAKVTFTNTTIDPNDPFAGPPYLVASGAPTGVGANLGTVSAVDEYMIFE